MKCRDFCYWLQGFFEISPTPDEISEEQSRTIQRHLKLAFKHEIDPSMGGNPEELQIIHDVNNKFNNENVRC